MHGDIETAATECAGNWRKFGSFAWDRSRDDDADRWFIWNTTNRDADLRTQSNHAAIEKALEPFTQGDDPDVRAHSAGHWACGWVEGFEIRVYSTSGELTAAFREAHELACALASYPILDESDLSEREYAALCEAIEQEGRNMVGTRARKGWAGDVARWLDEYEARETEDHDGTGASPSEESIRRALGALGWLNREHSRIYRETEI